MVATFHLHYLGHRIKYGNPEVGNTTQQFLLTIWTCCSIELIESFLFWVILLTYNKVYIFVYIYIKYSESIFPFMEYFFSIKLCFLWSPCILLMAESISLDTSGKPIGRFFLKITSPSWTILSISFDELNSIDWLLKSWWWIFSK